MKIWTALFLAHATVSTVLIADNTMSKMIELTTRPPFCRVHTDRGKIRTMLLGSDPIKMRQMSDESISKLVEVCESNGVRSAYQGGFIYPGTKWCGPGRVAANFSDLGYHAREDMCCRDHDNCPNSLRRGECKQGICNDSPFTRSHCDCDATFRRCLQNVNTETANTIGAIFFNVVQVICFKERSPCSQWQSNNPVPPVEVKYHFNPGFNRYYTNYRYHRNNSTCEAKFVRSGKFKGSRYPRFSWTSQNEFFINILLRKLSLL